MKIIKSYFKVLVASLIFGYSTSSFADSAVVYFTLIHNQQDVANAEKEIGNTGRVAHAIASKTSSDIFEIRTIKTYPSSYNEVTKIAKKELDNNTQVEIKDYYDMAKYKEIYLGYPIWWGTYPQAIKTFLMSQDFKDKIIYVFVTHEGSGFGRSIDDLKTILPKSKIIPLIETRGSNTTNKNMLDEVIDVLSKIDK